MATTESTTKQCTKCGNEYPATTEYFWKDTHLKDGLRSSCVFCKRKRELIPVGLKRCAKCKELLPADSDHFIRSKAEKDGLASYCKKCHAKNTRDYRLLHGGKQFRVDLPDDLRCCGRCKRVLPATREYFSTHRIGKGGLQSYCKDCYAELQRKYRQESRDKVQATEKRRNKKPSRLESQRVRGRKNYYADPNRKIKKRVGNHKRKARVLAAEGTHTHEELLELFEIQEEHCGYCGIRMFPELERDMTVEHVIPLSRGGSNWIDNILLACMFCNFSKNDRTLAEWEARRGW